jgi:hypothetical protein
VRLVKGLALDLIARAGYAVLKKSVLEQIQLDLGKTRLNLEEACAQKQELERRLAILLDENRGLYDENLNQRNENQRLNEKNQSLNDENQNLRFDQVAKLTHDLEITRAAAAEHVQQAQREVELTRAAAAEHARQAQKELELTRAVARDNVQLQIKRQLRQEEMEMRITLQQLECELESARAESWQFRQRLAECLEQKRLDMKRTEAPETDHR